MTKYDSKARKERTDSEERADHSNVSPRPRDPIEPDPMDPVLVPPSDIEPKPPERPDLEMPERASYRFIVVLSQYVFWLVGQILRLRYDIRAHRPAGIFERDESCLILSPTHKSVLDPWLLMIALDYRHFRTLVPIRVLATQTFVGRLRWLRWSSHSSKSCTGLQG